MNKKTFIQFIALALFSSASFSAFSQTEKHTIQTRTYSATKSQGLQAALSVFQDNLYTDIRLEHEIGLLQAEMPANLIMDSEGKAITKAVVKEGAGQLLGGMFGGGMAAGAATDAIAGKDQSGMQLNRVQATVEEAGVGKISVRFVFVRTIQVTETGGAAGGGQQKTIESDLTDKPEVYEKIFQQLTPAIERRIAFAIPATTTPPTKGKE